MLVAHYLHQLHYYSRLFAIGAVLLGSLVLLGWWNDIPTFYQVNDSLPVMPPTMAIPLILSGITLYLLQPKHWPFSWRFYLAQLFIGVNLTIGTSSLLTYLQWLNWSLWEAFWVWLLPESLSSYLRPAPQAAIALILLNIGLFILSVGKPFIIRWLQWATVLCVVIMTVVFFGYAHGEARFYLFNANTGMSIYAATALVSLGWGIILARVEQGDFSLMATESLSGTMLRQVLVLVGIIPLVLGWLPLVLTSPHFTPLQVESLLSALIMFFVLIFIIMLAHRLNRQEQQYHTMEENARHHQAEVAHILRINTVGEMATSIAHEINQPLAAIANYAAACQRLIRNGSEVNDLVAPLELMQKQALRASEIVRRLRSFVTKPKPHKEYVSLNALIHDSLAVVQDALTKAQVNVKLDLDYSLPAITVDTLQIKQVIVSIVQNALDVLQKLNISSRRLVITSKWVPKGCLQVDIYDTGPGIPPDVESHIFEAFFTTKLAEHMGMGLPLSRSIIEAHGGSLWVNSAPNEGTTFSFTLPTDPIVTKRTFAVE